MPPNQFTHQHSRFWHRSSSNFEFWARASFGISLSVGPMPPDFGPPTGDPRWTRRRVHRESRPPERSPRLGHGPDSGGAVAREGPLKLGEGEDVLKQLEGVQTFSHFMRMAARLRRAAASMTPEHFVTLCQVACRVKYFDGELFEAVFEHLVPKIVDQALSPSQLTEVVASLLELNACDLKVMTAAAAALMSRIDGLDKALRLRWLTLLAEAKAPHCDALLTALRSVPAEDTSPPSAPSGRLPCRHHARGLCTLGKSCTFSHESGHMPAPPSNRIVLTQMQHVTSVQGGFGSLGALHASAPPAPRPSSHGASRPPCRHFVRGHCQLGGSCSFRHDFHGAPPAVPRLPMPARTTSKLCIHFASGSCSWGAKCHFLHVVAPAQ